jgi:hypothetical protein
MSKSPNLGHWKSFLTGNVHTRCNSSISYELKDMHTFKFSKTVTNKGHCKSQKILVFKESSNHMKYEGFISSTTKVQVFCPRHTDTGQKLYTSESFNSGGRKHQNNLG